MDIEKIDIKDAHNRVLAENIYSFHDSPPFDKSAMDGYAVWRKIRLEHLIIIINILN